jgi:hypothetical protein
MIAQGLITGPEGYFGGSYYADILDKNPAFIRLDTLKTISEAIGETKSKNESLTVCLLEISDPNMTPADTGVSDKETPVFSLSPLPLSCISNVIFKSKADLDEFKNHSKLFSNISITLPLKVATTIEKKALNAESYMFNTPRETCSEFTLNGDDYRKVYAYGGVLTNLFYFSINNKNIHKEYIKFCELDFQDENTPQDIKPVYNYFFESKNKMDSALEPKEEGMYKRLLDLLVKNEQFKDEMLAYLESSSISEGKPKQRAQEIANNLRDFSEGSPTKSNKDFIIGAKSSLEKYLLLLFMRDRTDVLLQYLEELTKQNLSAQKVVEFDDSDRIMIAVLSGVRDKFFNIPTSLRQIDGFENYISMKMANYAHYLQNSDQKYSNVNPPLTFREILGARNAKFFKWLSSQPAQNIDVTKCAAECLFTEMPAKNLFIDKGKCRYSGYIEPTYRFDEEMLDSKCADLIVSIEDYESIKKAHSVSHK